jgi:hypothetical protein
MFQTTNQHLFVGSHFQTPTWRSSDTFVPKKILRQDAMASLTGIMMFPQAMRAPVKS